jgi:acyl-CoA dehydrogenase
MRLEPAELTEDEQALLIGIAEENGGSGGTLDDLLTMLRVAGRHAVPLPLAETSLAAWLLASCGAQVHAGPMTVIPDVSGLHLGNDRLTGLGAAMADSGGIIAAATSVASTVGV